MNITYVGKTKSHPWNTEKNLFPYPKSWGGSSQGENNKPENPNTDGEDQKH